MQRVGVTAANEIEDEVELRNRLVHFKVRDVHVPDPANVLNELYGDHILQGCVRDLTESGGRPYAVVEVEGVSAPMVVGVDNLLGVL
jgi:hypothetical protein